jgi:hypothetical protein
MNEEKISLLSRAILDFIKKYPNPSYISLQLFITNWMLDNNISFA